MTIHILVSRYFSIPYIIIGETNTLKIKQTTLSDKLEPQIWGLEWCSFKKPKVFKSLNGKHARPPKSTEG